MPPSIRTKLILMTIPFRLTHLGRTSHHSIKKQQKNTQKTQEEFLSECLLCAISRQRLIPPPSLRRRLFEKPCHPDSPSGRSTQCNEQIESHSTTYPIQYVILRDLVHSIHIKLTKTPLWECLPTLISILFQETQNFHYFCGVSLTDIDHESQT